MPKYDKDEIRYVDYIPQETMFWRRSLWDRVGAGLDEDKYRFSFDWDLILRFKNAGARIHRIPHFTGCFRIHQEQKTSTINDSVGARDNAKLRLREFAYIPLEERIAYFSHLAIVRSYLTQIIGPWF